MRRRLVPSILLAAGLGIGSFAFGGTGNADGCDYPLCAGPGTGPGSGTTVPGPATTLPGVAGTRPAAGAGAQVTLPSTAPASGMVTTVPSTGNLAGRAPSAAPAAAAVTAPASSTALAFTGADVAATAAGGLAVIAVGGGLVRASRRRKA